VNLDIAELSAVPVIGPESSLERAIDGCNHFAAASLPICLAVSISIRSILSSLRLRGCVVPGTGVDRWSSIWLSSFAGA